MAFIDTLLLVASLVLPVAFGLLFIAVNVTNAVDGMIGK